MVMSGVILFVGGAFGKTVSGCVVYYLWGCDGCFVSGYRLVAEADVWQIWLCYV